MIDAQFVAELEARANGPKRGAVKRKEYDVLGFPPTTRIVRWRFNEWDYYSDKAQLPSQARGLFTYGDRVLLRGYNKFFNQGETKATKPEQLASDTEGPFYATLKENGFLVMIGALNGKLVVTSKNSSGEVEDGARNHARVARDWVMRQLAAVGRTESDFAELLAANDWTAVGEVCDDAFEEHVLPYPEDARGIYLNGLNRCSRAFVTEPPTKVAQVAAQFGFRVTDHARFETHSDLLAFLQKHSVDGRFANREVEGFVIRCRRNGEDFFWKYKFEEPYLMYREWREVLKTYLASGHHDAVIRARRGRHTKSSMEFLAFAVNYIDTKRPDLKHEILENCRGLFEIRDQLYASAETDGLEQVLLDLDLGGPQRVILATVATLGCGKSTVAESLCSLLPWAHRQSDNMSNKKGARFPGLVREVFSDLQEHEVCILDRNNSMRAERTKLFELIAEESKVLRVMPKVVCLNFLPEGVTEQSRAVTRRGVLARGDNHQSVQVSSLGEKGVVGVIADFERRFQKVVAAMKPDSDFDLIIDLKPGHSKENVKIVLDTLRAQKWEECAVPQFSEAEIGAAVDKVVSTPKQFERLKPKKKKSAGSGGGGALTSKYFGVMLAESDRERLIKIARESGAPLDQINVQSSLHVTLAHVASHREAFDALAAKYNEYLNKPNPPTLLGVSENVTITGLAWSEKCVAFSAKVLGSANEHPHITVGTKPRTPHKDAAQLFEAGANVTYIRLDPIVVAAELFVSP